MENMDEVREWVKSRTAVSAASIQRKFRVTYPAAARAIDVLQEEARITEDWDASEGGYVVLGRQSNTGLQADGGDASPKTLICGWCGNHRKGELNDGVRCSCGGNSWLICTLGCLEHEQLAAAKA